MTQFKRSNNKAVKLPQGFSVYGLCCGIKDSGNLDLGLIHNEAPSNTFGAFTQNDIKAPPVLYCKKQLQKKTLVSHVLINSGVANACTGEAGYKNIETLENLWRELESNTQNFLMCSTGVIGQQLPMTELKTGLMALKSPKLQPSVQKFAKAIMTTDTVPKLASRTLKLAGKSITLTGFSKGAGMINPNMATMLAYFLTDISLPKSYTKKFLEMVNLSFNSISVDGDMSTNDTVLLMSNQSKKVSYLSLSASDKAKFDSACLELFKELAKKIVRDGEGATKLIEIDILGAKSIKVAKELARVVANSPLVKTAFFGNDPNWGRIIASIGSKALGVDEKTLKIKLGKTLVFSEGSPKFFNEKALSKELSKKEVALEIDLNQGKGSWTFWTCDLSYDYVKINAEYHT